MGNVRDIQIVRWARLDAEVQVVDAAAWPPTGCEASKRVVRPVE